MIANALQRIDTLTALRRLRDEEADAAAFFEAAGWPRDAAVARAFQAKHDLAIAILTGVMVSTRIQA